MEDLRHHGETVVLKEFNGNPILGKVWSQVALGVLIHDEHNFAIRKSGGVALGPVWFPAEDVFSYEPHLFERLGRGEIQWSEMNRWRSS